MTNPNTAPSGDALPYDLDGIREVFENNNAARREARQKEVNELNRVMAESAARQAELDDANERLLNSVLRRLAFTESLLKQEREIKTRLQATIDTFTKAIASAAEPLQLGVEDAQARSHTCTQLERNFREQYEPPRQPEPNGGGGSGDGGQHQPVVEPSAEADADDLLNDLQNLIDKEREATERPVVKPAPVMPLAPAARARPVDDDLEIPAFLRRTRPEPSETTVEPPPVSGHAEELFHRTAAVVAAAAQHVGEAARGHFGRRAA